MKKTIILFLFSFVFNSAFAQIEKMQAAFLYNFTMLVNWPDSYKSGDFVIAVLGSGPINKELEDMSKQKKAGAQTIVIKKIASASEIGNAHMVFVANSAKGKIAEVVSKTSSSATLVVTESDGAGKDGAIINFMLVDEKLRFELNEPKATSKGLNLASNLLKLGIPVK
jgi:hypothetical protein